MTYTLAMASDKGIQIAEDGIAEVSMTDARALLTPLIRDVRWGNRIGAFTERGERNAYLVKPDFYEQALLDRRLLVALSEAIAEVPNSERPQRLFDAWAERIMDV